VEIKNEIMSNFNSTSSSDDDWTVVPEQSTPTRRSATPFQVIDKDVARGYNANLNTDEVILHLREENRKLTEEWHRLHIENEWMAKEIKGARFLLSQMFETLCLDHNDQAFGVVMRSNVREDLMCFQNLTKKLLYAVENGMIQKVKPYAIESMKKPEQEDGVMPMDTTFTLGGVEQVSVSSDAIREATDLDVAISVMRGRLPRIEEFVEVPPEVRPRKTRRITNRYHIDHGKTLKPAVLHHVHGIPRKKRWSLNRGAPRQAYTARRNC